MRYIHECVNTFRAEGGILIVESYSDLVSPTVNPGAQTTIRNSAPRYDATEDYCSSYMVRLLVKCKRKIETPHVKAASLLQTLGQLSWAIP